MPREFVPLAPDEPIGVVALSGPADPVRLEDGLRALKGLGNPLVLAPNLRAKVGYLAGTDGERLEALEWVLEQGARVLIGARGGYGATRLLDRLPWSRLAATRATLVGFSDITAVIQPLIGAGGPVQVHGPMVAAGLEDRQNRERLAAVLTGRLIGGELFRFRADAVVCPGRAEGAAAGGNLSMITTLLGTPYQPDLTGCVLFLEEVDEPLYRLDRMLTHLYNSGTLRGVKALMSGSLHGCRPAAGRAERWRSMLHEVAPPGVPVVVGLPFGHGARNLAFPLGAAVEVDTEAGVVTWSR